MVTMVFLVFLDPQDLLMKLGLDLEESPAHQVFPDSLVNVVCLAWMDLLDLLVRYF